MSRKPFESGSWWRNYIAEMDEQRSRATYPEFCVMLILAVLVVGFIARLTQ